MESAASNSAGRCLVFDLPVELHLLDKLTEKINAQIHGVSSGLMQLSSPTYLRNDQKLQMVCTGQMIESVVAFCRRRTGGVYDVAVEVCRKIDARKEVRIAADLTTRLFLAGSPTAIAVKVFNLSPSGLGIELPSPIPSGAQVSVEMGSRTVQGEIRHCARNEHKYRAGIQLEKLIPSNGARSKLWANLNNGSANAAAMAAFLRSIDERQSSSEAILFSLVRLIAKQKSTS